MPSVIVSKPGRSAWKSALEIGQGIAFPIAWELHRLPAPRGGAAERRAAALRILLRAAPLPPEGARP